MFLSLSIASSSALLFSPPACFISPQLKHRNHINHGRSATLRTGASSSLPKPRNLSQLPLLLQRRSPAAAPRHIISRLSMNQNDDDEKQEDDEEEDIDSFGDDVESNLDKISWLPSVKLGKQPYKPTKKATSRKESTDGANFISSSINNTSPPSGYQNIEILPVLPMTMVHGLEGINLAAGGEDAESMLENTSSDGLDNTNVDDTTNLYYDSGPVSGGYGMGVWEEEKDPYSALIGSNGNTHGPLFSGTSSYLPHTKGHIFTVAEPRYKKLYDDLLRMGNYYGMKRDSALRRAKEDNTTEEETTGVPPTDASSFVPQDASSLPDPDEKRRFIVTASNPAEDGVFAEYGLLFQLKDLDEIAAVASYEMGGEGMTMEELQDLVESHGADQGQQDYDGDENGGSGGVEDFMDILLRTHYEATHDVVGRVRIHRFTNPEVYSDGPEGEEYLMAEATVLDVVDNDRVKMLNERKKRAVQEVENEQPTPSTTSLTAARKVEDQAKEQAVVGDVAKAVARITEELRSSVGEAFNKQQQLPSPPSLDSDSIKDKLRAALDDAPKLTPKNPNNDATNNKNSSNNHKGPIPLGPKGMYVERRSDNSLSKEELALRDSFAKLVALQHELKEECRFTRVSVQTFGVGPVGVWLSAAAWSQFVEKRLEASHGDMQKDLQAKLAEYLAERGPSQGSNGIAEGEYFSKYGEDEDGMEGGMEGETIDFEELSPELQNEFQLVQARATEELGPLALERAIQMQRIVQAESYSERLDLLRECVDNERKRLEAKKMLKSLGLHSGGSGDRGGGQAFDSGRSISREEARSLFERLIFTDTMIDDQSEDQDEEAFQ